MVFQIHLFPYSVSIKYFQHVPKIFRHHLLVDQYGLCAFILNVLMTLFHRLLHRVHCSKLFLINLLNHGFLLNGLKQVSLQFKSFLFPFLRVSHLSFSKIKLRSYVSQSLCFNPMLFSFLVPPFLVNYIQLFVFQVVILVASFRTSVLRFVIIKLHTHELFSQ